MITSPPVPPPMRVDTTALKRQTDLLDLVPGLRRIAGTEGGEYAGPCPFCGGTDRFHAQPHRAEGGRWRCRQCSPDDHWGDVIAFVMQRDGVDFCAAVERLGGGVRALPPRKAPSPKRVPYPARAPDVLYSYPDASGTLLYQVCRWDLSPTEQAAHGKTKLFIQRRPDGRGGWIANVAGVGRVLYRLPDLLAADAGAPVFVCEGEKDADRLAAAGLLATTVPGGTGGGWRAEYTEVLRGRRVVLVPDTDAAGVTLGQTTATALQPVVAGLRLVTLPPEYKDVSAWLDGGHTVAELIALADAALPTDLPPVSAAPAPVGNGPPRTDYGNAERLVAAHGADLRYAGPLGWLVWDGGRWQKDDTGEVMRRAKATVRAIYAGSWALPPEEGATLRKHAAQSESAGALNAMVQVATSEAALSLRPTAIDTDPWLLTTQNGTIDLYTGDLRPAVRADLITRRCETTYDPLAECPAWEAFLARIFAGNADLINYLQRVVGYALTGSIREQCLFLLYGTGANGKSTFLQALQSVLGDYSQATPATTLLVRPDGAATNDVARLAGARFVAASETEEGKRLAEALIKQMTGGDRLVARFLRQEFFEFIPIFKLFLATNHKPVIRGTDPAIWRRIHLIPFAVTIPPTERDPTLLGRLRAEAPGILAWAVSGCLLWQQRGLQPPKDVLAATDTYRAEMDLLGTFLTEACVPGRATLTVTHKALYAAYAAWAEESGERPLSSRAVSQRLQERGLHNARATDNVLTWYGIGLQGERE